MKPTQQPLGQQGFSLVELLVAITILSVGLFALAQMQTIAMKSGTVAQKITAATSLGQEAMEDILSWDPSNPALNTTAVSVVYANNVQVTGAGSFNITYATTINTPAIGTTQIVVRVVGNDVQPVVITGYKRVV